MLTYFSVQNYSFLAYCVIIISLVQIELLKPELLRERKKNSEWIKKLWISFPRLVLAVVVVSKVSERALCNCDAPKKNWSKKFS